VTEERAEYRARLDAFRRSIGKEVRVQEYVEPAGGVDIGGLRIEEVAIEGDEHAIRIYEEDSPVVGLDVRFADALDGVIEVANGALEHIETAGGPPAEGESVDERVELIRQYARDRHQEMQVYVAYLTSTFDQMWLAPKWPAAYWEYRRRALVRQARLAEAVDDMARRRRGNAFHPDVLRERAALDAFKIEDDGRVWGQLCGELENVERFGTRAHARRRRELLAMGLTRESWDEMPVEDGGDGEER